MHAAVKALRPTNRPKSSVAVPVSARDTYKKFKYEVDDIVAVALPEEFVPVGQWYRDFRTNNRPGSS